MFGKIFGSELLFSGVGFGLVCFGAVLPMFLLHFCFRRSRNCLSKILSLSGPVFLGCSFSSFGFSADVDVLFVFVSFFFSRETAQVVIGHTPTRTLCFFFLFLSVSPPHPGLSPVFGRASFPSGVLSVCHFGPQAFFGFSRDFSEALFSGREAARVLHCFSCLCCFSPFSFCFAASHLF